MDNSIQEIKLQWIKGDKIGNVESVVTQNAEWTNFQSGSRIATPLINEFMIPIEGEPLELTQANETFDLDKPKLSKTANNTTNQNTNKENPIKTLFNKQKKTDDINLNLSFSIKVPTRDIFNIISMTFGEDEVAMELDSFISEQIDEHILKDTLRESIKELVADRYKDNS